MTTKTVKSTNPKGKTTTKAATKSVKISVNKRVSPEERIDMISTAAYFIAEKRGFGNGNPEDDWLIAESQIENELEIES